MVSGTGVFYPDRTPTQRTGILPDVALRPTLAGLRRGRDEVLEEAIRRIDRDYPSALPIRMMPICIPATLPCSTQSSPALEKPGWKSLSTFHMLSTAG